MAADKKNVFYVKYLADEAIFKKIVGDDGSIALTRLENDSPTTVAAPVLAAAHGVQVGASRDELAKHFHVTKELLAQCPKLLVVTVCYWAVQSEAHYKLCATFQRPHVAHASTHAIH